MWQSRNIKVRADKGREGKMLLETLLIRTEHTNTREVDVKKAFCPEANE